MKVATMKRLTESQKTMIEDAEDWLSTFVRGWDGGAGEHDESWSR